MMNRNILRIISLLPLIVACSHDEAPGLPTGGTAMGMAIGGVSLAVSDKPETRAGNEGTVTAGSIGIFLTDASTGNYSNRDNCRYTYTGGNWAAFDEDNIVSVRIGRPALLWAVYPHHADHTEQTAIPLSPRAFSNAEDLCYGPGTTTNDKYCQDGDRTKIFSDDGLTPVPVEFLNMKHTYAWFTFEIKKENYTGAGVISRIRVGNIVGHTTMDVTTATATEKATIADAASTTYQAFTLPLTTNLTLPGDGSYVTTAPGNGDMLLVPCALTNAGTFGGTTQCGLKVTITADGEEYFAGIPVRVLGSLEGGKHYTVQLTLQDMNLSDILVVVSSEWKAAPDLPGGSADGNYEVAPPNNEPEPIGIQVPVDEIDLGGAACTADDKAALAKLIWANGNLKSTGDGNYVWTTKSDYGYYYTWNSTYTGSTSTNNTDPCSKLNADTYGSGWRTPSKNEFDKLSRCTDKTLINGGMWFMNSSTGLFLPAAGDRSNSEGSGTTATNRAGTNGSYWSSDAYSSSVGYRLYFSSGSAGVNGNGNAYGFPVRCVKSQIGIQVPVDEIDLGGSACTADDKADLAKLTWANGNLKSTGSSDYVWTTADDYGYYYTWNSTYTGNTSTNDTDPCSKLNAATYGSGWRTPSKNEFDKLSRCTDKTLINGGMWFMNSSTGLFLPAARYRSNSVGSGTTATYDGTIGEYWSSDAISSNDGYTLHFTSGGAFAYYYNKSCGLPVRCVKGTKQ